MLSFRILLQKVSPFKVSKRQSHFEPVRLAYASYENTNSPGTPLIVNHGLFGSKSNWNSLCKVYHKKTDRKVIALDARNHGESPHSPQHTYEHLVSDLKNLIDQLQLQKVSLLGHSMGGRAVMLFALKFPSVVEKLIVADISPMTTSPHLRSTPALFKIMQSVKMPKDVTLSVARVEVDKQLAESIPDKGLRSFLLTNLVKKNGGFTWRINIPVLDQNFQDVAQFPQMSNEQYGGPVLFIGGGASDFIPRDDHQNIKKLFPRAEFQYIEGAGHWLHSEKPAQFLDITIEFLNRKE